MNSISIEIRLDVYGKEFFNSMILLINFSNRDTLIEEKNLIPNAVNYGIYIEFTVLTFCRLRYRAF